MKPRHFYEPDVYDARAQGVHGDVEFFVDLAREARASGHSVLELACGTGRVAIPIAREGAPVVGLDSSPAMLGRAREKSADLPNIRFVNGDMRDFSLPERFGLAMIPFRSFQHLLTVDDQLACLGCIHAHLVPGGRLVINVFNPNITMIAEWLGPKRGSIQRRRDDYQHPSNGRKVKAWESLDYRTAAQEANSTFIDEELDDDGAVISRLYGDLKLRYVWRYEMEHLFALAGYDIEALYGDFARSPFGDDSPEMVWIVRTPA